MTFDFPIITLPGDLKAVAIKCMEESIEVYEALDHDESPERICEEISDLRQAVETLQRRAMAQFGPLMLVRAADEVEEKNRGRGYYSVQGPI